MVRSSARTHVVSPLPPFILGELFTSVTRARLLTLFLTHPTEEYYLRELARRTGQSLRAVQHELPRLERLELVLVRRQGRQKFYRANEQHPLFPELRRIVYKTAGLGDVLRDALAGVEGIDALCRAIRNAEKMLGRKVSLATMGPDGWRGRLASRDAFVADLLKTDQILLAGDERALRTRKPLTA